MGQHNGRFDDAVLERHLDGRRSRLARVRLAQPQRPGHLPSRGWRLVERSPRSRTLPFWHAVATDPNVIPYGSRVFLPAYCDTPAHGWFRALDTGGAIIGFHVDVYRPPPTRLELNALRDRRMYVLPPGTSGATPRC